MLKVWTHSLLNIKRNEDDIKVSAKKQWKTVIQINIILEIEDNIKKGKIL